MRTIRKTRSPPVNTVKSHYNNNYYNSAENYDTILTSLLLQSDQGLKHQQYITVVHYKS